MVSNLVLISTQLIKAFRVCLAIPFAGGRLFEIGMEEFFRRRKEILGNGAYTNRL